MYHNFSVKVQNNGYFSEPISIGRGVHQGGCCSSLYFLVIAEILAISLRSNEDIEGITIKEIRNLLNQFADDMDIFSKCTEKSLKAIHTELLDFRKQSGFLVSYDKTNIYRIGSLRFSSAEMFSMSEYVWTNSDINVFGVTIAHENIIEKNYDPIIDKAKNGFVGLAPQRLNLDRKNSRLSIHLLHPCLFTKCWYYLLYLRSLLKRWIILFGNFCGMVEKLK